jgi:hypothetical protein
MGYKASTTSCTVQLVVLYDLPPATIALCEALRREAGRCWSDLLAAHLAATSPRATRGCGSPMLICAP